MVSTHRGSAPVPALLEPLVDGDVILGPSIASRRRRGAAALPAFLARRVLLYAVHDRAGPVSLVLLRDGAGMLAAVTLVALAQADQAHPQ